MSSPLVKVSEDSWSLCCLCCNCGQEVKDVIKMSIGAAFVEYNHRFTCPHCQTYNQINLTRDMFENAQMMTFQAPAHNEIDDTPINFDFNLNAGGGAPDPLFEPGAGPSFDMPETTAPTKLCAR